MRISFFLIISLVFSIVGNCYVVYAGEVFMQDDDYLLILGPGHSFKEQIKYIEKTWPYNFSINIVMIDTGPECHSKKDTYTYCNAKVKNLDTLYLKWLSTSPKSPGHEFTLHYWYKTGDTKFIVIKDTAYIVFLAPTHSKDVFSPTLITKATAEYKKELKSFLTEHFSNR
jgi:hypothetical protein